MHKNINKDLIINDIRVTSGTKEKKTKNVGEYNTHTDFQLILRLVRAC